MFVVDIGINPNRLEAARFHNLMSRRLEKGNVAQIIGNYVCIGFFGKKVIHKRLTQNGFLETRHGEEIIMTKKKSSEGPDSCPSTVILGGIRCHERKILFFIFNMAIEVIFKTYFTQKQW